MRTLELESYGVKEICNSEMKDTNGGFWPYVAAVVCSLVASTADKFIDGMYDEYQSRQNKTPVTGAGGSY